eukprot:scaffold9.g3061.t1
MAVALLHLAPPAACCSSSGHARHAAPRQQRRSLAGRSRPQQAHKSRLRGYNVNVEELDTTEAWGFGQVGDIMTSTKVVSASPDQPLSAAASKLDKITGLAVVDADNYVVGVVSIKDVNRLKKQGVSLEEPVSRHMSTPPIVVKRDTVVADAAALMLAKKIHRLPVVDNQGKLIGIVSRTDVFRRAEEAHSADEMLKAISVAAGSMSVRDEAKVQAAIQSMDYDAHGPDAGEIDAWEVKYLMCLALVSLLRRQDDGRGLIKFVNIASMNYNPAENEGILYEEAMETIHAVLRNGTILKGTEALKNLYDTVGLGWAARFGDLPVISNIVDWVYELLSKMRLPIGRSMDAMLAMRRMKMTSEASLRS